MKEARRSAVGAAQAQRPAEVAAGALQVEGSGSGGRGVHRKKLPARGLRFQRRGWNTEPLKGTCLPTRTTLRGSDLRTRTAPEEAPAMAYPFELPALGYAYDALEPHIDA
ncbi:MAG: hypothetical protein RQ751_08575, partial [Longimicrobiales bacterium]|nr:hypothetical protein [Longimicrobiales bacterium]